MFHQRWMLYIVTWLTNKLEKYNVICFLFLQTIGILSVGTYSHHRPDHHLDHHIPHSAHQAPNHLSCPSQVPQLYCIQLGVQYPKNSKIWLWLLPQPTLGNALVEVDKNWNISGLVSGFQLEKLVFIHTVRSNSHSTATAEFVKATAGFVMSSEASDQLYFSHFSTFRFLLGNIWLFLG